MSRRLTKTQTIAQIHTFGGNDADFVANVIMTQHTSPARKLSGLLTLLVLGADVRTADRDICRLMVNGYPWTWTELECGDDYIKSLLDKQREMEEDEADPRCGCCCVELHDDCGKLLGCYGCAKAFCSAGCLESHERTTGHGEHQDAAPAGCTSTNAAGQPCKSPAVGPNWKGINQHTLPVVVDPAKCSHHQDWAAGAEAELALIDADAARERAEFQTKVQALTADDQVLLKDNGSEPKLDR